VFKRHLEQILKIVLIVGSLLFGGVFIYSFTSPQAIEKDATKFIKYEIKKNLNLKIDSLRNKKIVKKLYDKNAQKIEKLKTNLNKIINSAITKMQDFDCECRKKYAKMVENGLKFKISILKGLNQKLKEFIKFKYINITQNLIRDFRIFSGSNFFIFLLLLIILYKKPQANLQITLVAGLLFVSVIISSYFYIFEQNWFFTIIYNDYIGFFYLAYIGALFLLLCDIIFNKARVTTEIINILFNAIGSSLQALSC